MSAFTSTIPNLLNGVSTQAATLRLTTQGGEQINGYSTLTRGLLKRPPSHLVKNIGAVTGSSSAHVHMINRDAVERYLVFITNGDLKVYDLAGNAKTVAFPDGKTYLNNADPKAGFAVTTIADYTFIVNRSTVTAMRADIEPVRPYEAIVTVLAGNYGRRYQILLNGSVRAQLTTPDGSNRSHNQYIDTTVLAQTLEHGLLNSFSDSGSGSFIGEFGTYGDSYDNTQANGTGFAASAPWSVTRFANSLYIANSTTDFTLSTTDGFNNNAMKGVKGKTQRFSTLPEQTADGTVLEVTGESSNNFDNYWVKYELAGKVWKEARKPGVKLGYNAATMPHVLIRESDGTFTFKKATWGDRLVGDEDKSPEPSFIGQAIGDVFIHRNRLGFVAGENVILSASGDFFNFWRRTLTSILDSDPIDVGSSFPKVAILRFANSFNGDLLTFAENAQFRLTGGDLLTPKSAAIRLLGEYNVDVGCRPLSSGSLMHWVGKDNDRAVVRELWLDDTGTIQPPLEANSHCTDYVPKNIFKLASSSDLSMLVGVSTSNQTRLYVYKYYWSGRDKPQSSWSYWEIGKTILSCDFIDTDLYLTILDGTDVRILKVPCQVGAKDTGMAFQVLLDQRVELGVGSFDAGNNRTSYTMPYTVLTGIEAWTGYSATGAYKPGHKLQVNSISGTTIRLTGDTREEKVYAGYPYTFQYRFSPLYVRKDGEGSTTVITEGRTQLLRMRLTYAETGYFKVEVTPENRAKFTYDETVNAWSLDDPLMSTTDLNLEGGDYSFPVKCENTRVDVDIINDSAVPSGMISAEWVALWYPKTRRQ
jgi:hypothetical protein